MASLEWFLFCNRDALGNGFIEDNAMGHSHSCLDAVGIQSLMDTQTNETNKIPPLRPMKSLPVSTWATCTKRRQNVGLESNKKQQVVTNRNRKMPHKQHRQSIPSNLFPVVGLDSISAVASSRSCSRWDNGINAKEAEYLDFFKRTKALSMLMRAAQTSGNLDYANIRDGSSNPSRCNPMLASNISSAAIGGSKGTKLTIDSAPRLPCRGPPLPDPMRRSSSDTVAGSNTGSSTSKHCSEILTEALALVMFDDDDDDDDVDFAENKASTVSKRNEFNDEEGDKDFVN